jgi:signal transduction histidine kinase/CheY-like chemotaxis protein/HPt (histidine-containing phosphotransfer) domain-containing protein
MLGTLFFAFLMISRHARTIVDAREKLLGSNQSLRLAKDAAEHANASKDTFLATMSHEIRTPMSGLLGMLELLALTKLSTEQAQTLVVARDAGQALGRIIDDILDHAKINAGKLAISPEPVSLRHLLQRNASTYFAVASHKGLTLCQMVDPRLSQFVLVDPLRLLQVLGNLVSNAIKFTEKGSVEVRAEWIGRADGIETVRLSVKDTGIGMTPEVQARVFQPFEQAGIDTQRLYGGTGLGLAISRRLAQMMGSDIVIESAPGLGTTMSVTLELTVTDAQPMERLAQGSVEPLWHLPDGAEDAVGPWVLAVDDNPTNRLLITRQLATLGMRVQTAAHGQEALSLWHAGNFALVITDCNMPEMDGYALTRAIRSAEVKQGGARTPVLGWTANALPNALSDCRAAGMDDVLTKPSQLQQLRAMLAKCLPDLSAVPAKQAPPAIDAALVNLALLQEVCGNSPEMLREFIQSIRTSFQAQIPELAGALEGQNMEAVAQASHKMKSSAGIIGAQSLLALCTRMEQVASSGDAAELPMLLGQFGQEAQRVMDALVALDAA